MINASAAGKTVVIHAFPGPAGINDPKQGGMFPTRGNMATRNTFHVAAWAGDVPVPEDPNACRAVAARRLVESLAPFLIVATERVFFGSECTLHLGNPRCATLTCLFCWQIWMVLQSRGRLYSVPTSDRMRHAKRVVRMNFFVPAHID